jgi:hypothetical protein
MVVDDLNVKGIILIPTKTKAPLVINPDAVLAYTVAFQGFKMISRRDLLTLQI